MSDLCAIVARLRSFNRIFQANPLKFPHICSDVGDLMGRNTNLNTANKVKDDEFYTLYSDIDSELDHYREFFRDKTVYCNCDNPHKSNFPRWFIRHFTEIGLKRLICTNYSPLFCGYLLDLNASQIPADTLTMSEDDLSRYIESVTGRLNGNGDFNSLECVQLLRQSDIVVTNPPFSLFRRFFTTLVKNKRDYILICHMMAMSYNVSLPYLAAGDMVVGYEARQSLDYITSDKRLKNVNTRWITSLPINKQYAPLNLKPYLPENYKKYDNYPAINVDKLEDIPDYDGIMGVPVTFLDIFDPAEYEVIEKRHGLLLEGHEVFVRLLVRKRVGENRSDRTRRSGLQKWRDSQVFDLGESDQANLISWGIC